MTIDDIPMWIIFRGIGHICVQRDWLSSTACGRFGNFHEFTAARPKRVCSACRAKLSELRPASNAEATQAD